MTDQEIFDDWYRNHYTPPKNEVEGLIRNPWIEFAKYYHEQLVKNCDLADVGGALPTNGEIEAHAIYECGGCSPESNDERHGIIQGAKWMRHKLIELIKQ